jgi:RecA-family ATPase
MSSEKFADAIPHVDADGNFERSLPDIEDAAGFLKAEVEEPAVLIDGLLHVGSKMVLGGGAKSFKTWTMIDLAVSVANGQPWMGRRTIECKVLYVNLEIQPAFFKKRIAEILQRRGLSLQPGELDVWNLRGYATDFTHLRPLIQEKIKNQRYGLIILDPIYKVLGGREENATGDIASLMNEIERLAVENKSAVVLAHISPKETKLERSPLIECQGQEFSRATPTAFSHSLDTRRKTPS